MTNAHKSQFFLHFLALTLVNLAAFCWPGKSGKASACKSSLTNAGVWLHTITTRVSRQVPFLNNIEINVDFERLEHDYIN